jgi:hypothetical protein
VRKSLYERAALLLLHDEHKVEAIQFFSKQQRRNMAIERSAVRLCSRDSLLGDCRSSGGQSPCDDLRRDAGVS